MKTAKILLFYFLLIIYSTETLLFFFIKENNLTSEDIFNKRIEIAKKRRLEYDTRTRGEAFLDFKKINKDLEPVFSYSPAYRFGKTFNDARKNNRIIPFRGPINAQSLTCAEDLKYRLIENDKYGFKNSNSIYKKKINNVLLGDSYAEGKCVNAENDIAGNLIKKGFTTVNFGVSGTSPLVALGIMREFGEIIKPKNFIYLYFEGNDLEGLDWEKNDSHLINYINDEYNINYLEKYDQIKDFLKLYSSESISYINSILAKKNKTHKKNTLKVLRENLIDILELKKIKHIIRYDIFNKKYFEYDLDFFFLVIEKMNLEAKKHNSNYIFVYVPHCGRYFSLLKPNHLKEMINLQKVILKELDKKGVITIDLTKFFDTAQNVKQYYPLGYYGHFNAKGYKKISDIIASKLN